MVYESGNSRNPKQPKPGFFSESKGPFLAINPASMRNIPIWSLIMLFSVTLIAQPNKTIQAFRAEQVFQEGQKSYNSHDFWNAIQAFNEVERLNPTQPNLFDYRAEAYYSLNRFQEAYDDYGKALQADPNNAELYNSRGVAAAKLGKYSDATDNFYQALRIDPNHSGAQKNLDIAQTRLRESGESYVANPNNTYPVNPNSGIPGTITNTYPSSGTWTPSTPGTTYPGPANNGQTWTNGSSQPGNNGPTWNPGYNTPGTNPTRSQEPQGRPSEVTFGPDRLTVSGQSDPLIVIKQIKITPSGTQVTFEVTSAGDQPFPISLDRPGGVNALFLSDQAFTKQFRLRTIRGLRDWPTTPLTMRPGDQPVIFTAEFDRIDDNMNTFHILEGTDPRHSGWDFFQVHVID